MSLNGNASHSKNTSAEGLREPRAPAYGLAAGRLLLNPGAFAVAGRKTGPRAFRSAEQGDLVPCLFCRSGHGGLDGAREVYRVDLASPGAAAAQLTDVVRQRRPRAGIRRGVFPHCAGDQGRINPHLRRLPRSDAGSAGGGFAACGPPAFPVGAGTVKCPGPRSKVIRTRHFCSRHSMTILTVAPQNCKWNINEDLLSKVAIIEAGISHNRMKGNCIRDGFHLTHYNF